jgi:hypothetical protein
MRQGATGLLPKISIHGGIILSALGHSTTPAVTEADIKKQQVVSARIHSVNELMSELPFPVTVWAPVFTTACPIYPNGHGTERGLVWAHYRIIREFAFFDPFLLHQAGYVEGQTPIVNTTLVSKDGLYAIYPNGTMYKNGLPFLDNDIITIFEDDAENSINNLNVTILEEFSAMNVDILYLGWCEGRTAKPIPLCAHAYALTRKSARKLVKYIEPCGLALDEQFVVLVRNNFITYRRVYGHSYKDVNEKYKNRWGEKTYGIFHQNKVLGSINGHRRR